MGPPQASVEAPPKLRLFTTFAEKPAAAGRGTVASAGAGTKPPALAAAAAGSHPWGPHFFWSSQLDLSQTSLLLHCIASSASSACGELAGFDRSSSEGSGSTAGQDSLAPALAEQLVPGWWGLTHLVPFWRWQMQALLESPCLGVPGIVRYTAARSAWMASQIQMCIDGDGCRQVVVLRSGLGTLAHRLAQPGVKFFEVDSVPEVRRKKAALDVVLPGWRHAAQRPRFVEVDLLAGSRDLMTHLTAAGFDPTRRCVMVAEGLLPYLPAEQGTALLADLSALSAPGSRLLFDFLHADALESAGADLPGYASLAASVANKGAPLHSGLRPAFSALVRHLQPHHFRMAAMLPPHEVARLAQQAQQACVPAAGTAAGKAAASGMAAGALPGAAALPYVPAYFSFASAVRQDMRLLEMSRHADMAGDADVSSLSSWAAGATLLSSPSCFLNSLAHIFGWRWGGSSSSSSSNGSSSSARGTGTCSAGDAPLAVPTRAPAGPLQPAPARQPSAEWTLAAGQPASLLSPQHSSASESSGCDGSRNAMGAPFGESELERATSIAAMPLPLSWGGRRSSSGSGEQTQRQQQQHQQQQDGGHLHAPPAYAQNVGIGGTAAPAPAPLVAPAPAVQAAAPGLVVPQHGASFGQAWGTLMPSFF